MRRVRLVGIISIKVLIHTFEERRLDGLSTPFFWAGIEYKFNLRSCNGV